MYDRNSWPVGRSSIAKWLDLPVIGRRQPNFSASIPEISNTFPGRTYHGIPFDVSKQLYSCRGEIISPQRALGEGLFKSQSVVLWTAVKVQLFSSSIETQLTMGWCWKSMNIIIHSELGIRGKQLGNAFTSHIGIRFQPSWIPKQVTIHRSWTWAKLFNSQIIFETRAHGHGEFQIYQIYFDIQSDSKL